MPEFIGRYTALTRQREDYYIGRCPHPDHDDDTPSFRVWKYNGRWCWKCFGCNDKKYGSDIIGFVRFMSDNSKRQPMSFFDAVNFICETQKIDIPKSDTYEYESKLKTYRRLLDDDAREYLHGRGISDETINKFEIGRDRYRIQFPVYDHNRILRGFCGRIIKGTGVKYLLSESLEKNNILYGEQTFDDGDYLYITEGTMDVIAAYEFGLRNVVCTMGCALSDAQAEIIKRLNKIPVLCYDSDKAGLRGINSAIDLLESKDIYPRILILPPGNDLADTALEYKESFPEYVESNTTTMWEYILQDTEAEYRARINEIRRQCLPKILRAKKAAKNDRIVFDRYISDTFGISLPSE